MMNLTVLLSDVLTFSFIGFSPVAQQANYLLVIHHIRESPEMPGGAFQDRAGLCVIPVHMPVLKTVQNKNI